MKFLFAFALLIATLSASAQRVPRVNIGRPCSVLMIDNWHRPVATYYGRRDILSRQCIQPMRQCRNALMARGPGRHDRNPRRPGPGRRNDFRCVEQNGRW
jgi:hypothetical protein